MRYLKSAAQDSSMDAETLGKALEKAGVNRQKVVLVWHRGYRDLDLLRRFLQLAGYIGVLPSSEYCVRLISLVHADIDPLPGRNIFSAKLDIIFPLFFPRHKLVGKNHEELPDCLQTRLLMLTLEQLLKPCDEREGWMPKGLSKPCQRDLRTFMVANHSTTSRSPLLEHNLVNLACLYVI